ncbi:hypothetical protein CAP36_09175 [Chitinophagaceae bacterium IBVUCB2]|nr:hypothetical protein CAP36_09175 [Chitinophagaceae bacterium IBVUCB2]
MTKVLPQGIELTSKYICRNFDFCIPIPDKLWLTSHHPNEQSTLLSRPDRSQLVIERDSIGRIISKIFYSCLGCLAESYGFTFSYDSSGNEVKVIQLEAKDIMLLRQGLTLNEGSVKNHTTFLVSYNSEGFIRNLKSSSGGDLLFSIKIIQ